MANKVDISYYDGEGCVWVSAESIREYDKIQFSAVRDVDGYSDTGLVSTNFYADPITGLVVFDVRAYEEWVR